MNTKATDFEEILNNIANRKYEQYKKTKEEHPDLIVLYREGDFYRIYSEDADVASAILGLPLATTNNKFKRFIVFNHHSLDTYLPRLVFSGHKVLISSWDYKNKK